LQPSISEFKHGEGTRVAFSKCMGMCFFLQFFKDFLTPRKYKVSEDQGTGTP
jgi:hypothetical protein